MVNVRDDRYVPYFHWAAKVRICGEGKALKEVNV
jgi:hypothetical protein